ncbi:uncharacterized protein LOC135640171 isoform X1 [Musa acuminata AAA Group]|uniref:uncharacterized protein LOC135640171 isoform X1 n=1 Tax=Musa acuminata AAA Group TaxID=214697 RepID=UPI0031E0142B
MSDDGERICPLCAEEMDLTDQQLKPCKCGYEICIWCWHHIIEMAEKEDTEARCPACRTPYDKDRVLKAAPANSERIIAEIFSEKKQRPQRAKTKISAEAMKHLSGARVMQKNLVYITGLPFNLCDENILERKEYFGQYGKVLKVSISRAAGTSSQKTSTNNTFGIYVTYAKEEEAVRCIQAVHNYVLEGKSLRACFGTTKYCRAWLRNMTCSNPDCLYLHDIGSHGDGFTKDEMISACTRVPQITSSSSQRRFGNVLPPPMDDFNSRLGLDKHPVKRTCINSSIQVKGSSNISAEKSNALPAAASWGLRGSNCQILASSIQCSRTPAIQNAQAISNSSLPSLLTTSTKQPSARDDEMLITSRVPESKEDVHSTSGSLEPLRLDTRADSPLTSSLETVKIVDFSLRSSLNDNAIVTSKPVEQIKMADLDDRSSPLVSIRSDFDRQQQTLLSSTQVAPVMVGTSQVSSSCLSDPLAVALEDKERGSISSGSDSEPKNATTISKSTVRQFGNSNHDKVINGSAIVNDDMQSFRLGFSSVNIDAHSVENQLNIDQHQTSVSDLCSTEMLRSRDLNLASVTSSMIKSMDLNSEPLKQQSISIMDMMKDPVKLQHTQFSPCGGHPQNSTSQSNSAPWSIGLGNKQPPFTDGSWDMDRKIEVAMCSIGDDESVIHDGHSEYVINSNSSSSNGSECPGFNCMEEKMIPVDMIDIISSNNDACVDKKQESSIISDLLSLDFDPWDDSLSSANNLARLRGEIEENNCLKLSSSWKSLNSDQSRFSFARPESQAILLEPAREISDAQRLQSSSRVSYKDGFQNRVQSNDFEDVDLFIGSNTLSDRTTGVSRAKITAPPGFLAPTISSPPGFSCPDRGNQEHDMTYLGGNHYQSHLAGSSGDVEFIDPAILAIGKGRIHLEPNNSTLGLKYSFPAQFSTPNNDPRLHLLAQQSVSSPQNLGIPDHMGERFLQLNDAYIASQLLAQSHAGISPIMQLSFQHLRNPLFSNSQWDAWKSVCPGNNIGMSEKFRNGRFGLNDYYTSTDENKFHIPSAGNLYNQAFGM